MEPEDLAETLVSDILQSWPSAAELLVRRGMSCPGCPFARFETLTDAATAYALDVHELAQAIVKLHGIAPGAGSERTRT